MKNLRVIALVVIFFVLNHLPAEAQKNQRKFFRKTDKFLKEYVQDGKVDYEKLNSKPKEVENLVSLIEKAKISRASEPVLQAFLLNAHNILIISGVLKHYPIDSPFDVEEFFTERTYNVAGEVMSLQELKQEKILDRFSDRKLYFGLSTGTSGYFPTPNRAFFPGSLDEQLKDCIKDAVNNENFVRVKKNSGTVLLSETMMLYKEAFEDKNILNFINEHRIEEIPEHYKIVWYPASQLLNSPR